MLDDRDREIFRLAWPALGALVAEPLYVLTDTAIVGHLGTPQLGGLSLASGVLLTGFSVFIFLAYGTTAAVARLTGAGEHAAAARQAVQGIWLGALIGLALLGAGWPLAPALVRALGHDPVVEHHALVYLRISLFGTPAALVMFAGVGYLRGTQDTRRPLVIAMATAVLNAALEVVFVYGLDRGIGASAFATVLVQWLGAGAYVAWVRRAVRAHGVGLAPDARALARLAVVGRDLFVRTAALRGSFLLGTAVAARIGSPDLAAYEVVFSVWYLLALVLDAIAIAGQAIVGRHLGGGDGREARAAADRMVRWAVIAGLACAAFLVVSRWFLPHAFSDDPVVVDLAAFSLVAAAPMQPICGAVFALDGILIGAGDQRYLARAMAGAAAVFVAGAAAVLAAGAGLGWLWLALTAFMAARLAPLWRRYRSDAWVVVGAVR